MIATAEIRSELVFRYFNTPNPDVNTIAYGMHITKTLASEILNDYMKPNRPEKFMVLESKMNDESFVD